MNYYNHSFWGMHLFWWIIWIFLLIGIFENPSDLPGQRTKKNTPLPLDILKKRFARGEIDNAEYEVKQKILQQNS